MTANSGDIARKPTSTFRYTPLPDPGKDIRLLEILPSEDDGPIEYILGVHRLAKVKDKFVAISYTWGEACNERDIILHGSSHTVRYNGWYALWQMRLHDAADKGLHHYYWIDSICINQNDSMEKSSQIRLMGQIYANAKVVAVCIGELAQDFIDFSWLPGSPQTQDSYGTWRHPNPLSPSHVADRLEAREYFRRLWVVQECSLAKDITMFCGAHALPHSHWKSALGSAIRENNQNPPNFTHTKLDLAACVQKWSGRKCSDLHDKVYGFLSMADPHDRACIQPDYSMPLGDMLQDYSAAMGANARPSQGSSKRLEVPAQSIAALSRELGTDADFREAARRFFEQRISHEPGNRTSSLPTRRKSFALSAVALGKINILNNWRTGGIEYDTMEDARLGPDFPSSMNDHSELRTIDLFHPATPLVAEVKANEWGYVMVPWNAREDDNLMQLTDLDNSFIICRTIHGVTQIIGSAVARPDFHIPTRIWCSFCGHRYHSNSCGCRWRCQLEFDDFLSLAMLHGDGRALLRLPFTTPSNGSYLKRYAKGSGAEISDRIVNVVREGLHKLW